MKFKVGDRVKFLNEKGGGIVSKIVDPKLVNVTIEDGFEIPVLATELIRIELEAPFDSPKHMFREDLETREIPVPDNQFVPESQAVPLSVNMAKGSVPNGIYLGFIPQDQKWLITGLLDIYFINYTPFDVLYSLLLRVPDGGYSGYDYGSCPAESMILLASIERDDLNKWGEGIVQVLFHPDETSAVYSPGNSGFKLKLPRFYLEQSYRDSLILNDRSLLISVLPLSTVGTIAGAEEPLKETKDIPLQKASEQKPVNIIDRHITGPGEAVVDLHIEELVENHREMQNTEILNTQINYFTHCLENGMFNNINRIIFIHGVGTGVLKTAMKEILKEYENVEYRDASMKDFGYGALEVIIRKN